MKAFGVATLGSDMEVKYLPDGTPVGEVSLAFRLMKKGADGKNLTQWVKAALFGKRVDSLSQFMTKGSRHAFHLSEIHVDEWTSKDGKQGHTLKARIDDIEFGGKDSGSQNSNQAPQAASRAAMNAQAPAGFDDDDPLPF